MLSISNRSKKVFEANFFASIKKKLRTVSKLKTYFWTNRIEDLNETIQNLFSGEISFALCMLALDWFPNSTNNLKNVSRRTSAKSWKKGNKSSHSRLALIDMFDI